MRKQIPFVEDFNVQADAYNNVTAGSVFPCLNVNGYIQKNKSGQDKSQKFFFVKRPVVDNYTASPISPSPAPPGVGTFCVAGKYAGDGSGNLLTIYSNGSLAGTSVYLNSTNKALPGTWAGNSYPHDLIALVDPASGLYANNAWAFTNFAEGALVTSAGVISEITDVDYTAWTTKTNMVAMDGYIFQGDYKTCKIWNSDLNAPSSWVATSFISANLYPGRMVRLVRVRNYLVAFKTGSIEFFKNAGNPTPGSPLDPMPELCQKYGACNGSYFTEVSDGVVFAGFTPAKRPGVFKLNWNTFEITEVSNPAIAELVSKNFPSPDEISNPTWSTTASMQTIPWKEKEFVTVPLTADSGNNSLVFVYDNELGLWYLWTCYYSGSEVPFPCSVVIKSGNGVLVGTNFTYLLFYLQEYVPGINDEFSTPVSVTFASGYTDFGTFNRKFLASLEVGYVVTENSGASDNPLSISLQYIDDNGVLISSPRTITLTNSGSGIAKWTKLGSFKTRRFVITVEGSSPFRLTMIEADVRAKAESLA